MHDYVSRFLVNFKNMQNNAGSKKKSQSDSKSTAALDEIPKSTPIFVQKCRTTKHMPSHT